MKRLSLVMIVLIVSILSFSFVNIAKAGPVDNFIEYINGIGGNIDILIKDHPVNVKECFLISEDDRITLYGVDIKKDVFIKNLNWDVSKDGDEGIFTGLNYAYYLLKNFALIGGADIGLDRIEQYSDLGQLKYGLSAGVKFSIQK